MWNGENTSKEKGRWTATAKDAFWLYVLSVIVNGLTLKYQNKKSITFKSSLLHATWSHKSLSKRFIFYIFPVRVLFQRVIANTKSVWNSTGFTVHTRWTWGRYAQFAVKIYLFFFSHLKNVQWTVKMYRLKTARAASL